MTRWPLYACPELEGRDGVRLISDTPGITSDNIHRYIPRPPNASKPYRNNPYMPCDSKKAWLYVLMKASPPSAEGGMQRRKPIYLCWGRLRKPRTLGYHGGDPCVPCLHPVGKRTRDGTNERQAPPRCRTLRVSIPSEESLMAGAVGRDDGHHTFVEEGLSHHDALHARASIAGTS